MKYIFSILLLISTAHAAPTKLVNIVAVNGEGALSNQQIMWEFNNTRYYTNQNKLNIKINSIIRINEISSYTSLATRNLRLYDYHRYTRALGLHRGGKYTVFVIPPVNEGGAHYWLGVALNVCANQNQRTAYTVGFSPANGRGVSGMSLSLHTFAHELEHLFGAYHDSNGSCSLMDPNALACVQGNYYLPLSNMSKKQINFCQRK